MAKILLVDDNHITALSFSEALSKAGHEVDIARDGGSAMLKLGSNPPDIVILDLMLPNINGWQFLDSKELSIAKNVPVIVVSGYTSLPQPLPEDQVVAVIAKPVDPEWLEVVVADALKEPIREKQS